MKFLNIKNIIVLFVICVIIFLVGYVSYFIGGFSVSLKIKAVTPSELARAMLSDRFYSDYPRTMLLVQGTVSSIKQFKNNTLVEFESTSSANVLPQVYCDIKNNKIFPKVGDKVEFLTVAHNALRKNISDVSLQDCYFIKN